MLKDTIISAFNYDGTLLKWLKKVENALQGDTLTNIEVVTNSDYSMQLKLTFGDNTFIMSPVFTNKGRGIVSISKTATSGLVDTYTVTYTDNTTSTFTVTNGQGLNANNLYSTLTAGTGIELTNDGQSVTVTAKSLLSDIVDANGNKRFVEIIGGSAELEGFTVTYRKASLSGSHLMCVVAGNITAGTTIPDGFRFASWQLPNYIYDKISPVFSTMIEIAQVTFYSNDWTSVNTVVGFRKDGNRVIGIFKQGAAFTINKNCSFRIQFDLLIDTD